MRRTRQTSDRLVRAEVTILPGTEDGVELVHLALAMVSWEHCSGLGGYGISYSVKVHDQQIWIL
jgi:hypothetical protein